MNTSGSSEMQMIFGDGTAFESPKPIGLIQELMKLGTDKHAITLDSFAGSGTTAHAVLALNKEDGGNRKFILVECEEYADSITAERVRRVINGVPDARVPSLREGLGGSFTYCTLGDPIDLEAMLTGEALPEYPALAAYLLHISAGISAGETALERQNDDGLYYQDDQTAYYLLYKPDLEYLSQQRSHAGRTAGQAHKGRQPDGRPESHRFRRRKIHRPARPYRYGHHFLPVALRNAPGRAIGRRRVELKDYQASTLDAFGRWLDALASAQAQSDTVIAALQSIPGATVPDDIRNYPKTAWQQLGQSGGIPASAGAYVDRTDEADRPIPHVCFKVPTGGGKTLLAAAALERLHRQTGLTLWITPTNAIYEQTKAALKNREHPYRQILELASGGRVKFMERNDPFTRADAANYLCVMLLSLPAANRNRNREFLRMFRDSGRYPTFFPDSDDSSRRWQAAERLPRLGADFRRRPGKEQPVQRI